MHDCWRAGYAEGTPAGSHIRGTGGGKGFPHAWKEKVERPVDEGFRICVEHQGAGEEMALFSRSGYIAVQYGNQFNGRWLNVTS